MTGSDPLQRVKDVFARVFDLTAAERPQALTDACGDDAELRRRVEALLAHHDRAGPASTDGGLGPPARGGPHQAGDRIGDRYRIVAFVGRGGMGEVYRADDLVLAEPVALKFLRAPEPSLVDALRSEVRIARQISHPAVCRIHDIGECDGRYYLTMEYVPGEDLRALLGRLGRLPPDKVLALSRELCDGLAAAHARGVLHRDLKPSNVMLDGDGHARILDFGIAVQLDRSDALPAGTPAYMAPELRGGAPATERSDVYALGLLLYETLTGYHPLASSRSLEPRGERASIEPPSRSVEGVPPGLERALHAALAEDPGERPASAQAMRALIDTGRGSAVEVSAPTSPFFGRESELRIGSRALEAARHGTAQVLLVAGEPGIGKTRLAEELCREAEAQGAWVLWGRGLEGDHEPAYWPFVHMLREYAARREPEALASDLRGFAADVAEVVPEIGERIDFTPRQPKKLEPIQKRFRFFDAVTTLFRNASRAHLLVLVLDDLHWADDSSLLLLEFLAQEIGDARVLVIATYREAEVSASPISLRVLGSLARTPKGNHAILLGGLPRGDIGLLVEAEVGEGASPEVVDAIYARTEGNPFFAREVARLVGSDSAAGARNEDIPPGVQQVIRTRVAGLPETTRSLLSVASVIGRDFRVSVLARATDRAADAVLEALAPAEQAGVALPASGSAGLLRFSHALVNETLYTALSTRERVALHHRVGEALEQVHAGAIEQKLAELAFHFASALPGGDPRKAFDYALRAAARDARLLAFEQAAAHAELALRVLEDGGGLPDELRCDALGVLAEAQFRAGRREDATATWLALVEVARRTGRDSALAEASMAMALASQFTAGSHDRATPLLREALARIGVEDSALRARLLAWLARRLTWTSENERRETMTREAVEMARRLGDAQTLFEVLAARGSILEQIGRDDDRRATYEELLLLAHEHGSRIYEADALTLRLQHRIELADPIGVEEDLAACGRLAAELRHPFYTAQVARVRAARALWRGELEEAEQRIQEAGRLGQRADESYAAVILTAQLGALRRLQGRSHELLEAARLTAERYPALVAFRCGLAALYLDVGRTDEARLVFEELARRDFVDIRAGDPNHPLILALLAETCVGLADTTRAETIYRWLAPRAGRYLVPPDSLTAGCASRYLAGLAATRGDWERADSHFAEAIRIERRMEARPWLAAALLDRSRARLACEGARARATVLPWIEEAHAIASAGGLVPLAGAAEVLRGELS